MGTGHMSVLGPQASMAPQSGKGEKRDEARSRAVLSLEAGSVDCHSSIGAASVLWQPAQSFHTPGGRLAAGHSHTLS